MLTAQKAAKAKKIKTLWPTLPDNQQAAASTFAEKISSNKNTTSQDQGMNASSDDDLDANMKNDEDDELAVPKFRNNLGDALANALNAVNLNHATNGDVSRSGAKKKKAKKTLLFASGMTFNGI